MSSPLLILALAWVLVLTSPVTAQGYRHGGSWETDYVVTTVVNAAIPFGTDDGDVVGIGDLDGDLTPDFAISDWSGLAVFSGASASSFWMVNFPHDLSFGGGNQKLQRIHDWDGDGIEDLMLNDRQNSENPGLPGFRSGGAVMVFSTVTGDRLWSVFGSEFGVGGFGWDADSVPDQNGDGIPDLAVAVENSALNSSSVFFLSGVDGSLIWRRDMSLPEGAGLTGLAFMEGLDGDQDGWDDLLLYFIDDSPPYHPQLMSMQTGAFLYEVVPPVRLSWRENGEAVVLPDQNGDGVAEFALRAGYANGQVLPDGGVTCVSGADGAELWTALGQKPNESLGVDMVRIPDRNADGYPDLAASAPNAQVGTWPNAGQIRLISGKNGKFIGRILGGEENSDVARMGMSIDYGPHTDDMILAFESGNLLGLPDGRVRYWRFHPFLTTATESVSAAAGASFDLDLDLPDRFALKSYALLLSKTGYGPTTIQGVKVPLTADSFLQRTRSGNHFPFFDQPYGQLDAAGDAVIPVTLPAGTLTNVVGATLYAAAVIGDPVTGVEASSVMVSVEITP